MMKKILAVVILLALVGLAANAATKTATHTVTITVSAIASIAVVGGNVSLALGGPASPGAAPTDGTSSTTRLAYTVAGTGNNEVITVNWGASDAAPAGTQLQVVATSVGSYGTAAPQVTISATAQSFITAIPSSATGTAGVPVLNYTLHVVSPASLVASSTKTATITYTLTAS